MIHLFVHEHILYLLGWLITSFFLAFFKLPVDKMHTMLGLKMRRESCPDRLRLPFKPTVNRFREKKWENGKIKRENGRERERLGCFPDRFHGSRFQPGKIPREFPYLS